MRGHLANGWEPLLSSWPSSHATWQKRRLHSHFANDHSAGLLKRKNIAYWSSILPEEHYGILHFMATRFIEVLPNRGVDDNVGPIPQMIVPLRGTNHILLIDGEGLAVQAESPHMLEITEVKNFVRKDLPKPRMFRLRGR